MRKLDRYIFREIFTPGLLALVALTFVVFTRKTGPLLDLIIRRSPTASEIWSAISTILPVVLTVTLPMAVLVGILTGFSRMSSDSEAIAMRASGISMRRLLRPVLAFAFLSWVVTLALTVWIAPRAAAHLRSLEDELARKYSSIDLKPRVFYEKVNNYVLYPNAVQQAGRGVEIQGFMVADTTNPDEPEFTFAESGSIVYDAATHTGQLILSNASKHVVAPSAEGRYDISKLGNTTISLDLPPTPTSTARSVTEIETLELWNRLRSGDGTPEERVEFHQRLALPFACLAFALLGLPLGVSTNRGGRSIGLVLSLVLMFAYYLALVGGTRATAGGAFPPVLGAWLPNVAFTLFGLFLLARSDRAYENRTLRVLGGFLDRSSNRLAAVRLHRLGVTRWAYSLTQRVRLFRLLDIYVLRGFWFFFAIVLGVFAALFIVVTLFELLPDIIKNDASAATVAAYFVFLLPQIFFWMTPLAVLLAILINLGTLTKSNEVLAVKAGAVSLYRMSLPLLLMGGLLSGGIYVMQDFVLPWTNQRQDEYRNIIKDRAPQTYGDPYRKWMMGSGNRMYHYKFFNPDSNTFANISILTLDPETFALREWIFAERAHWNGANWTFERGWERKIAEDPVRVTSEGTFDETAVYQMDPPAYFRKEVREADQMNYAELRNYIEEFRRSGLDVSSLTVALYRKLSFPMVSFIMALIGVPFSFKTGRKGAFYGIGLCLAVGILYWSVFELFEKLGGVSQLSPVVAAWFPNLIFGLSGFWMMLRVKT